MKETTRFSKNIGMRTSSFLAVVFFLCFRPAFSETLVFRDGTSIEGTIIQTNGGEFLILTEFSAYNFAQTGIKEIRQGEATPSGEKAHDRVPDFRSALLSLSRQAWASNLKQIPATVIDEGVFKNVPYVSFRCSDDYEVNIYGDLKDPAAIEAGVYRKLLDDDGAKRNCLNFIIGLLGQTADREIVQSLIVDKDIRERSGLRFETTPPSAKDAYLGWWISVYSEEKLDKSRASEKEMAIISVSKTNATPVEGSSGWTAEEMKLARSQPAKFTFTNSSGDVISNAFISRVINDAYIICTRGPGTIWMVKLSDLPENVRARLGYDPTKALAVYAVEEQAKKDADAARARN